MTWSFLAWSPDDSAGAVYDVTVPGAWEELVDFYAGGAESRPLDRIVAIAREHGVRSVVVEQRHLDPDWRSEHGAFHGRLFRRRPSVCHRWHLFTDDVPADLSRLRPEAYRGYVVLRPLPSTPVGRTMLAPPPGLDGAIRCDATERVSLFGTPLSITAMPFLSQDAEYLRCAHATLWMVLRHAHLAHDLPRRLTAEVHDATLGGVIVGRQIPSEGLSVQQMLAGATRLGLSPGLMHLPSTPEEDAAADTVAEPAGGDGGPGRRADPQAGRLSLRAVLCRYVNSQLPPIVISASHAWVVVAHRRDAADDRRVTLWRHDDARGPYLEVADPFAEPEDAHRPWQTAILPLLPAVYVTAERAEAAGRLWFAGYLRRADDDEPVARAAAAGELTFRTYVVRSDDFLEGLTARGVHPALADLYRLAALPEHLWVVEAVDRAARREARPDVVGEALVDATASTHHEPLQEGLVALHGGRLAHRIGPDHGTRRDLRLSDPRHYRTGRPGGR
ncbi:hypothetical protein Acsp06_10040 [Actinomycetospora sp. NBRC 106375]|uniref:hypothetical protein n=1 Tax=Actinomycetospora sp. NBRC 106375 TaxID=3032207 RepID=UPI0024A32ACA|nr:hypothetical protein [Actinomycetospora sp. NBRC 106375]GLZ44819.1 hypothetical protein Acsp06_10040 [Actinomycetospora sp. NBRC 106375]